MRLCVNKTIQTIFKLDLGPTARFIITVVLKNILRLSKLTKTPITEIPNKDSIKFGSFLKAIYSSSLACSMIIDYYNYYYFVTIFINIIIIIIIL